MRKWLLVSTALAAFISIGAMGGFPPPGQWPGTATNDTACAGCVGEVLTASGGPTSLTTSTPLSIVSKALTAGDWDVWCGFSLAPAATTTVSDQIGTVGAVDNTLNVTVGAAYRNNDTRPASSGAIFFNAGPFPIQTTGATYYCVAQSTFTVSTLTASATIFARRRR